MAEPQQEVKARHLAVSNVPEKKAQCTRCPFAKEYALVKKTIYFVDDEKNVHKLTGHVRKGAGWLDGMISIVKQNGGSAEKIYLTGSGEGISPVVLREGENTKVIRNPHGYFDRKLPVIDVDGNVMELNFGNIEIDEQEVVVVDEEPGCGAGRSSADTKGIVLRKGDYGELDPNSGMISWGSINPGMFTRLLQKNLAQPLGPELVGSFEPAAYPAGFAPALSQNFSSHRLMELLRVEPLKQECNGELEVILYYNGIGTRGIEWNPARIEALVLPSAERREFVAAASGTEVAVQECRVDAAPAAQQAPMQFAYDAFDAPARFRKEKRAREKPVETKSAAGAEKANERKCKNPVRKEKAEARPSVKRAADETPFWRIDSKGRMKPFHAPRGMDEGAPAPMPKLKVGVPELMGKFVFGREKTSPAKLSVVEKAKDPMPLREKKKKRRRRPEMKQVGVEKPAEKPKRPAAKVRFGDAVPLSSGIQRKKVRREMPAVELKLEKRAKRRAEKRKEIALGQEAAVSTKRKARKGEKAVTLDEEAGRKKRKAEGKKAARKRMDAMEYIVMSKGKKRGKRRYWAPLSLR